MQSVVIISNKRIGAYNIKPTLTSDIYSQHPALICGKNQIHISTKTGQTATAVVPEYY